MRNLIDWRRIAVVVPVLLALAVALWVWNARESDASTPRAVLVETPAPGGQDVGVLKGELARDFVGTSPDGALVRLSDLRGRPVIVNFWATWCGSCAAELPELKALQADVGADGVAVVIVNSGETVAETVDFLAMLDAPALRIAMDPTLVVSDAYGVQGLPLSVFIDAEGVIRTQYAGHVPKELARQYVDALARGDDPLEPAPKPRLITTVARDHVLSVRTRNGDEIELRSKALRCDESHCAGDALSALASYPGVRSLGHYSHEDPPRAVIGYLPQIAPAEQIVDAIASLLRASGDPLYERPLEVRYE